MFSESRKTEAEFSVTRQHQQKIDKGKGPREFRSKVIYSSGWRVGSLSSDWAIEQYISLSSQTFSHDCCWKEVRFCNLTGPHKIQCESKLKIHKKSSYLNSHRPIFAFFLAFYNGNSSRLRHSTGSSWMWQKKFNLEDSFAINKKRAHHLFHTTDDNGFECRIDRSSGDRSTSIFGKPQSSKKPVPFISSHLEREKLKQLNIYYIINTTAEIPNYFQSNSLWIEF